MQICRDKQAMRDWRGGQDRVALVPTMGALHDGHLSLVAHARRWLDAQGGGRIVTSIFVNPTQFGPNEDLATYPRDEENDIALLRQAGCDAVFLPAVADIYRPGAQTVVEVTGLSRMLMGRLRPGHFRGVATVVTKLFNIVRPDAAAFGEKDYQQLAVIRALVQDLNMPIQIIGAPTQRAEDGLALSSRNGYLSDEQRAAAPALYRGLQTIAEELRRGARDYARLIETAQAQQRTAGFIPDYLEIRNAVTLRPAQIDDRHLVILTAAQLGGTRLIDNLVVELPSQ